MTVTYTDNEVRNTSVESDTFVPRYARTKRAKKGVRTWMILAPIGALALIGGGAAMIIGGGAETQPLVEPEPAAPSIRALETSPAPLESSIAPAALTPAASPAPVVREAPPAPPPAVQRRVGSVERRAVPAPAETPSVEAVPEPAGASAYSASPSAAATPEPAPSTPPAPSIQTAPLN